MPRSAADPDRTQGQKTCGMSRSQRLWGIDTVTTRRTRHPAILTRACKVRTLHHRVFTGEFVTFYHMPNLVVCPQNVDNFYTCDHAKVGEVINPLNFISIFILAKTLLGLLANTTQGSFMFRKAIAISFLATLATTASADAINLSSWNELTLDFPGGQNAGDWVLAGDNESVTQIVNADPSFYLNGLNQTTFTMDGTWQVLTGSDDDYMGFVFGYQNSSNFYLFDWKKNNQGYAGTYAYEGMTVKKMEGSTGNGLTDLSLAEFWENGSDYGDMSVLATNHGGTKGWVSGVLYDFHLDFNQTAGEFNIVVKQGSTTLWDVTVADSTFTAGQFGFYNYSQEQVRYAGFTQTGGVIVPVPAPASLLLLAIGLLLAPRRSGT